MKYNKLSKDNPGPSDKEDRGLDNMDDLVQALIRANRERRRKSRGESRRGMRKIQSLVDKLLSGKD